MPPPPTLRSLRVTAAWYGAGSIAVMVLAVIIAELLIAKFPVAAAETELPIENSPNCEACELVARGIEIEMGKLEEPDLEGLSEEELARRSSRRRKLLHGRSELKIGEVLDTVCEGLHKAGAGMLSGGVVPLCTLLMERHADAVSDHVFAEGPKNLRDFLCVRLARLCPKVLSRDEL
mmetsp:Transcript_9737/g.24093  ORF Transcript_9737/g.24093 Transcript_9737/m.24093 type:complete len:177 (+) Transcript_9737:59-589(+)